MADQPNMMEMLKQARGLQKRMNKIQKKAEKREVGAEVGDGAVQVVCSGKLQLKRIIIDPALIEEGDKRRIQSLIVEAVNLGMKKAQDVVNGEMEKVAADMGLGGNPDVPGMPGLPGEDDGAGPEEEASGSRLSRWLKR